MVFCDNPNILPSCQEGFQNNFLKTHLYTVLRQKKQDGRDEQILKHHPETLVTELFTQLGHPTCPVVAAWTA